MHDDDLTPESDLTDPQYWEEVLGTTDAEQTPLADEWTAEEQADWDAAFYAAYPEFSLANPTYHFTTT